MQSISSRIWTRVAVSISYDDNNYTTGIDTHLFIRNPHAAIPANMFIHVSREINWWKIPIVDCYFE